MKTVALTIPASPKSERSTLDQDDRALIANLMRTCGPVAILEELYAQTVAIAADTRTEPAAQDYWYRIGAILVDAAFDAIATERD